MSIIGWIILGMISGWIAGKIVDNKGKGLIINLVLGVVGSMVGGWIFTMIGAMPVTGFNLWSLFVSVVGAVVVLVIYHALFGRRSA